MARQPHGWEPKEDGHSSSSTVVLAANAAVDAAVDAAADVAADKEADVEADATTTSIINKCC